MQPKTKLSGIEYLLVCIQSNPGKSQRYYLRRLHQYRYGYPDPYKGGSNAGYFRSPSYKNVLWVDQAEKNILCEAAWSRPKFKPKSSKMVLTKKGFNRANEARIKIGLKPLKQ